jgi:hypothetical protein
MNIVWFKRFGRWLVEKLVDAVVYLLNLLLLMKLWSPKLKVKKKKQT